MEIVYLLNSGFMIRDKNILLVFDDFEDPAEAVDKAVEAGNFEQFYIFASHAHFDHFSTHIRGYFRRVTRYIFSYDIKRTKRVKMFPPNDITYMRKYNEWAGDNIKVWTYDSTDVGVSFMIETVNGTRIFHAGDFNWWHWDGDNVENQLLAQKSFERQLKRMRHLDVDVAFFPVDGRLGDSQEKGAVEFVKATDIKSLVAMHRVGYPRWQPSEEFFKQTARDIPIWAPVKPGERRLLIDGKFIDKE